MRASDARRALPRCTRRRTKLQALLTEGDGVVDHSFLPHRVHCSPRSNAHRMSSFACARSDKINGSPDTNDRIQPQGRDIRCNNLLIELHIELAEELAYRLVVHLQAMGHLFRPA